MSDQRRRTRRVLYLVGLLPSILLLLLSARIALLLRHESAGLDAYEAARFASARDDFGVNRVLNPVQPWVAPFNEGDARYLLEDFEGAVSAFETALDRAPEDRECVVRVNLALAHEGVGDDALEDGDRQPAEDAWEAGLQALDGCPRPADETDESGPPEDEATRVTAVRVEARLLRKLGVAPPVDPQRREEPPPADEELREKQRKLEERNRQSHEDRVEHRNDFDPQLSPSPSPTSPVPQW